MVVLLIVHMHPGCGWEWVASCRILLFASVLKGVGDTHIPCCGWCGYLVWVPCGVGTLFGYLVVWVPCGVGGGAVLTAVCCMTLICTALLCMCRCWMHPLWRMTFTSTWLTGALKICWRWDLMQPCTSGTQATARCVCVCVCPLLPCTASHSDPCVTPSSQTQMNCTLIVNLILNLLDP